MDLTSTIVSAAIIFALTSGAPDGLMGRRLEPGEPAPAGVAGILLAGVGVAHLAGDARVALNRASNGLVLEAGRLRIAVGETFFVVAGETAVVLAPDTIALVSRGGAHVEVCVVEGEVRLHGPAGARAPDDGDDDNEPSRITSGGCRRLGRGVPDRAGFAARAASLRLAAERARPPAFEPPDVVGDLDDHLVEIESEWSDALEQGPRQEASSCGCAEDGGSSGGLDPGGGSGPDPEPERPDPGSLRIRVRLPFR